MKSLRFYLSLLTLTLFLSACSGNTHSSSDEISVDQIYTAAAMTFEAQKVDIIATETPIPSVTPTSLPTTTFTPAVTTVKAVVYNDSVSVISACDNSAYVSDVTISDGTEMAPGESFTKTWLFENTGTCTWSTSYSITYVSGSAMSGSTTVLDESVSPGEQVSISVEMVAPTSEGDYTGYWKIQNAAGTTFGQSVYVQIEVTDDASTVTPTPTATDEDDATSTPTTASTSTATSTSQPSSTPTIVPTSTEAPADTGETETAS
jgi:hypothetical protein